MNIVPELFISQAPIQQDSDMTLLERVERVCADILRRPMDVLSIHQLEGGIYGVLQNAYAQGEIEKLRRPLALMLPKSARCEVVDRPETIEDGTDLLEELKNRLEPHDFIDACWDFKRRVPEFFPIREDEDRPIFSGLVDVLPPFWEI